MILNMRHLLLSSFVILSLAAPQISYAKRSLDISNLSEDTQKDLRKRFPRIDSDQSLSLDQLDEILRYLQLKPFFTQIKLIENGSGPYKLEFRRTQLIGNVEFKGLSFLSTSQAENIFTTKSGDIYDQTSLIEEGEKLRQHYKDHGFYNAVIDIEMPPKDESTIDITVRVTENKQTRIQKILITSPNEDLNRRLTREVSSALRDPFTEATLAEMQKNVREYLTKNRYVRTDLIGPTLSYSDDESEVQLSYRLEKVDRYSFEYQGAEKISARTIEKALDLDNFYSANPSIASELLQKVRAFYISKGFARVEVATEESKGSGPFRKHVVFKIEEGPKIKLQKIAINGKYSKKDQYYIDLIKEHSSALIADGIYNKDDLELGTKNLVLELQNNGFLQAKILSTRTQYNKEKDKITFYVNLEEGPLTEIQTVDFQGNSSFTQEELIAVTQLQPGPLKLVQIENAIAYLKRFYHEQGYIEMILLNEKQDLVTYDPTNTKALLKFNIFEGPQVSVGSIIVEGNTFTKESVILKELEFTNNELITPSKLEESVARLQRTGFFGSVEVKTLEEKTNVARRTVLVKVTERDPGIFNLGLGATNERTFTLRGYTGVAYRNLWGTGRGVSLRLEGNYNVTDIKYLENKIILGYLEPYIFGSRVRGRVNLTRSRTVTDFDLRQVTESNSVTYSLEKDFTSHILGVWDLWSIATIKDFGLDDRYPFPESTQDIGTTGPTLDLDFRDNPFNPSRGTFSRLNAEYSSPSLWSTKTIEYWRATLSFTHYKTLAEWSNQPVVWANQVRGGYLKNLSSHINGGVPWDKKGFILGGRATVRGYEAGTQEVFPNRADLGLSDADQTYFMTTEASMYLFKSELRFPVYGNLGGAIFYDGGSVLIKDLTFKDSYRDSAGFGIRYNTPVGPLSLEFAWKLDQRPNEEPWRFHLSIGSF